MLFISFSIPLLKLTHIHVLTQNDIVIFLSNIFWDKLFLCTYFLFVVNGRIPWALHLSLLVFENDPMFSHNTPEEGACLIVSPVTSLLPVTAHIFTNLSLVFVSLNDL